MVNNILYKFSWELPRVGCRNWKIFIESKRKYWINFKLDLLGKQENLCWRRNLVANRQLVTQSQYSMQILILPSPDMPGGGGLFKHSYKAMQGGIFSPAPLKYKLIWMLTSDRQILQWKTRAKKITQVNIIYAREVIQEGFIRSEISTSDPNI